MSSVFDQSAATFARSTDAKLQRGTYLRGRLFLERVRQASVPGGTVLDFGCGPGRIARMLADAGYKVLGVDPSEGMIAEARILQSPAVPLRFDVLREREAVLTPQAYDAIVCSSVIEYVEDATPLLVAFHGALRAGGALILSFANVSSLWRTYARIRFGRIAPHYSVQRNVWTWRRCREVLEDAGFRVVTGPVYFDSPFDERWPWFGGLRSVGTLGMVTAMRDSSPAA